MAPIFFYGTLRDLDLLAIILGRTLEPETCEPAVLENHATLTMCDEDYPVLVPRAGARAEGVLVRGLGEADLDRLHFYEEDEFELTPVTVTTAHGPVDACIFRPDAVAAGDTDGPWSFEQWQAREKPVALEAAREYMDYYGRMSAAEACALWPGIRIRALQRARAAAEAPRLGGIRRPFGPEDVRVERFERAYTGFLAVHEFTLRHRRFAGGWTAPLHRSAVLWGDAVTVLPYDARRDRVLLIEQFRAGSYARGDPNPWCIEVVAGRIDQPETPEQVARREAREEAGLELGRIEEIAAYYPTSGLAAEHLTSYVGEAELAGEGGLHGLADEHEDIRTIVLGFDEAMRALAEGAVNTSPAVISLLWLARHRRRLRTEWGNGGAEA